MPSVLTNFTLTGGETLSLAGGVISLVGTSVVDGIVQGPGTLVAAAGGTAAIGGLLLDGGANLEVFGIVDQVSAVQFGTTASGTNSVTIEVGGSYVLLSDDVINAVGPGSLVNAGLFEKAGTDQTSTLNEPFVNQGQVLAAIGIIDFAGPLTNDGTITASAATVTVTGTLGEAAGQRGVFDIATNGVVAIAGSVDAGESFAFIGAGGVLRLSDPAGFAGTIGAFGTSDTIDLAGVAANGLTYASGVLTVTETQNAVLQHTYTLAAPGIANSGALALVVDNAGGTEIVLNHVGPQFTNPSGSIITDNWTVDANGTWNGADWFQVIPEPAPVFSETIDVQPNAGNDAEIDPNGTAPFTVTYNETDTANSLSGSAYATLALAGGVLTLNDGGLWNGAFFNTAGTLDAVTGWSPSGSTGLAAGATDEVDSGTFQVGSATLAGRVFGQGEFLLLGGDNFVINPGFSITSGIFDLSVNGDGFGSNTTLDTNLAYAGHFILADYSGNAANLFLNGHTLTLSGQQNLNGYISGAGALVLSGTAEVSQLGINNSAAVTVSGTVVQDGALTTGNGTLPDDTLLAIGSTGVWDFVENVSIGGYGGTTISNAGLLEKTGGTGNSNLAGSLFVNTGTIDVASGQLGIGAASNTLAGLIEGPGEIIFDGGDSFVVSPGATILTPILDLAVNGDGFGSNTTLATNLAYAGQFLLTDYSGNAANLFLNGHTLTLTGQQNLNGYVSGSGALDLAGTAEVGGLGINNSATVLVTGSVLQDGGLTTGSGTTPDTTMIEIAAAATWDIVGDNAISGYGATTISNAGLLEETGGTATGYVSGDFFNTGTISVAGGAMVLQGTGTSTLAGVLTGAGSVILQGSSFLIDTTVLNVPALSFAAQDVALQENLTYAGVLVDDNEIDLNGHTLTLTGLASLNSSIVGPGALVLANQATLSNFTDTAPVLVTGTIDQAGGAQFSPNATGTIAVTVAAGAVYDQFGYAQFGASPTDTAQIGIAAGAIYDLTGDNDTNNTNTNDDGTATISNAGLLEKTQGTGTSVIYTDLVNTGTVLVAGGVLDIESISTSTLNGAFTGAGALILGRNDFLLDPTVLNVPTLSLFATDVTLQENLAYAGVFTQGAGEIDLNGETLTLANTAALAGFVAGPGTLVLAGASSVNNFNDVAVVRITGTVDQTTYAQFGAASTDAVQVIIAAGGAYDLTSDNDTNNPNSNDDGTATITNAGLLAKTAGTLTSTIFADVVNTGTVAVASGVLDLALPVTGAGALVMQPGAGLALGGSISVGQTVEFGGGNILSLGDPAQFSGTIANFATGDQIDLPGINYASTGSAVLNAGTLAVTEGGSTTDLLLAGNYAGLYFHLAAAAGGGTAVSDNGTPCYCRGTLIRTEAGEVPVETLQIGDRLMTQSGALRPIRWIGRRSYAGRFAASNPDVLPVLIRAGALADAVPSRDLFVSPLHALYFPDMLIPAAALVNGRSIVQVESVDRIDYFHIELATHDVIFAEAAAAETFVDDDSRGMFHNAAEFARLYPDLQRRPARYCAPRMDGGQALEAVRRRLAARACPGGASPAVGTLLGGLDEVRAERVRGWALDAARPEQPVHLKLVDNGVTIGTVVADRYRMDLAVARGGQGRHGFEFTIPGGLSPLQRHLIEVQRIEDGRDLPQSPWLIEAAPEAAHVPVNQAAPALRGCLDVATRERISGWVQDGADPDTPVALRILDNGVPIAGVLANRHRPDLAVAGIGRGWHSFEITIPGGLAPLLRHVIQVTCERDGTEIPGSPRVIEAINSFDTELKNTIAGAVTALGQNGEPERVLSFMLAQTERLRQQLADAEAGRAARQGRRAVRPRTLVVDARLPVLGRDAGSAALLSHIAALRRLGYDVTVIGADEMAPGSGSLEELVRRQAGCFDLVYLHRADIAARYLAIVRHHCPRARIVYSVADLHHVRLARQAVVEEQPELAATSERMRLTECVAAVSADAVITHSAVEAAALRLITPGAKIHQVPWHVPVRSTAVPFEQRGGVAFIGNYAHAPNIDAACWLAEAVMPLVRQIAPDLVCLLVGSEMPERVRRLPGVVAVGHVEELGRDVFDRVRLTVAPLRYGAGVKGKILESLAAGVPCVMSEIAAEGIDLPPLLQRLVARDAAGMAALICTLHADQVANQRAAKAGMSLIRKAFSREAVKTALLGAISAEPGRRWGWQ